MLPFFMLNLPGKSPSIGLLQQRILEPISRRSKNIGNLPVRNIQHFTNFLRLHLSHEVQYDHIRINVGVYLPDGVSQEGTQCSWWSSSQ